MSLLYLNGAWLYWKQKQENNFLIFIAYENKHQSDEFGFDAGD